MSEQTQPRRSASLFRRRSRSSSVASSVKNGSSPYQQEDLPPVPPMPDNANEKAKKKFGPIPVPRFGISRTSSKQSTANNDRVHKEDVKEGFKKDEQHAKVHSFDPNEPTSQKEAELKETQKSTTDGVEGDNLPKPPTKDEEQPEAVPEASIVPPKQQKTTPAQTTAQKGEEAFKSAPIYAIDDIPGYLSHKEDNLPSTTLPKWYMRSKELPDSLGAQSFDITGAEDDGGSTLLPEKFYGQWFHNAAVVLVSSLFTYTLAYFNFGIGPLAIVGIASVTYYNISISKVDKDVKDGISRQLMKPALESESESADWVNNFLMNFWTHLEPYICEQVITNVEPIIAQYKPGFIKSVRLAHLTLGSKAPRILSVRTWPSTADNIITMDWKVAFTPANLGPLGEGQTEGIVNPKIVVQVVVGNGKFTTTLPVILEDFSFLGNMRVKLTLINDFPHVKLVDLSFIEKPEFDYIAKPIGGESFGLDVNYIPGLTTFIREQVYGIMQPMMFDPNVFTLNLQEILAGGALDSACGVLVITIRQARGLRSTKIGSGAPDPYTTITVGNSKTINDKTKTLTSTDNPVWMETKYLLVNSLNDQLVLNVYDYNEVRKDSDIGLATINLQSLANDPVQELVIAKLLNGGKERGDIRFDLNYYPVMESPKEGESLEAVPDLPTGVVRLYVHEAKDLDTSKSKLGRINPAASVFVKGKQVQQTNMVRHTKSPVWDSHSEFLAANKDKTKMQVKIYHAHNFKPSMPLATVNVDLSDLLDADDKEGKWYNLGKTSGQVRLSASFKSVAMDGALDGAGQYTPPIGLIRVFCKCAHDLKNVEAAFGGKSDPYIKAILGGKVYGRTNVIDNNLSPVWNEHLYIPIHSLRDVIYLEAVDYQNLTKDRPLGHTTLRARDIIKENDNDEERKNMPYIATGINRRTSPMKLDKGGYKGELEYQAEFIPAWKIKGSTFENEEEKKEEEAKIAEEKKEEEKNKEENGTENVSGEEEEEEEESAGLELTEDELLERESGILVVNCESGELAHKNSRLEFLLDDAIWPTFSTEKARSKKANWNHIGEGLVRELSFSQLRIRLNTGEQDENDQVYAETSMDVREFLYRTLNKEAEFTLSNDEGDNTSKLKLSSRYVPVEIELSLRESVNNQGNLRVEVHNAKGLASADRNGKSDPYAVFLLEGEKVYKTETKKKTLNPEWDEYFEVEVPNRVDGNFMIEVYDWDRMSAADLLGVAKVDLTAFEPLESTEFTYDLKDGESGDQGNIKVSFVFKPSFIIKTRSRTSTFSHAGRALTQVGGIGIGAGKGVVHGAGHIGKGAMSGAGFIGSNVGGAVGKAGGLFHIGKKKSPSMGGNESFVDEGNSAPRSNNAQMSDKPASRVEVGDLNVTVVKAWDLKGEGHHEQPKPKPVLRMGRYKVEGKSAGKTSEPSFDESFILHTKPEKPTFSIEIVDKHLFGDRQIGYNSVMIGHYIHPEKNENSAEFDLELLGAGGYVTLKLQWSPSESRPSTSSMVNDTTNDNTEADDTQSVSSKLKSGKSSRFASLGRNSVHKDR
ncbi:hypothetical protein E3Q10_04275 [Wallemia mellicola]|uniref:Tricalbin n=1 Tax=Wallemia mellicola TaxID=1708541 RepID=A0A4T0MNM3_9BASI|nr:hypothetical protein E3Q19_04275 [Wallemia mellicola]TIC22042.1 hypothetical protein E3Q11_04256 [Wallemia mellicola]TIC23687.1 hypothetical protein E3Q10_04275 [Wallemia mellicola]